MGQTEFKGCLTSDQTFNTVKINATLLTQPPEASKTGLYDGAALSETFGLVEAEVAAVHRDLQEQLRREVEEELRREHVECQERLRAERISMKAEAEAERDLQKELKLAACAEEERERARAAAEKGARRAAEKARLAAQRKRQAAQKKVDEFLLGRGFRSDVGAPLVSLFSKCYALHMAVQENSAAMVEALLLCGADASAMNSSGKTALEVAERLDKKGSHQAVLAALSSAV